MMRTDHKELQEGIRLLKQSVLADPFNAPLFQAMARERIERIQWCKKQLDLLFKIRTKETDTYIVDFWIEKRQKLLTEAQTEYKRFTFYAKLCKGTATQGTLDVEKVREYPIGDIMPTTPRAKTTGRYKYLCPLHNENTESFVWYVEQNRYHCYGCNQNGDVIDLMMKLHNLTFVEAVKQLIHS